MRRLPPLTRVGDAPRHPVHGDGGNRIAGAHLEVDRLFDQVAGPVQVLAFESGLSHTDHQERQQFRFADPAEVVGAFAEEPFGFGDPALL